MIIRESISILLTQFFCSQKKKKYLQRGVVIAIISQRETIPYRFPEAKLRFVYEFVLLSELFFFFFFFLSNSDSV